MAGQRDIDAIRSEIEHARDSLARTVDELSERLAPQRLAEQAKSAIKAKATSPQGKAVLGAIGALVLLIAVRNLRRSHRH